MLRWFFLASLAALLLIACAQAASQPTATNSPVGALPSTTATTVTAAPSDTAVPAGTTPPTTGVSASPPPAGTPTFVLVTPSPTHGTSSTATPGKTNGPTDHPATTATPSPKPATPSPKPATPSPKPATPSPKVATPSPKPATPTPNPTPTKAPTPSPAPTPNHDVTIVSRRDGFKPGNFTIRAGESVKWYNADGTRHTVTSDIPGQFDSGNMDDGDVYSKTFNTPGAYNYHCDLHESMQGTITVNE